MGLPYRWLAACILLSIATTVRAYSTGVPAAACTRIYPEGHNGTSQNLQSSPFVLDISQFYNQLGNLYYTPGYTYVVTLSGGNFRGFLIQARSSVSGTPLGTFSVGKDGSQQLSQCSPSESAVSHANNSVKNNVSLTWTAPAARSGPIVFLYAVVVQNSEGVSTFYATLNTTVIPEGCANPLYLNGSTCVTSCPPYYYGNYTSRLCLPCECLHKHSQSDVVNSEFSTFHITQYPMVISVALAAAPAMTPASKKTFKLSSEVTDRSKATGLPTDQLGTRIPASPSEGITEIHEAACGEETESRRALSVGEEFSKSRSKRIINILNIYSNNAIINETTVFDTLFRSPEQEQKGFRLGSIIVSVGGIALNLASQLQFSFQLVKEAANASKIEAVQWTSGPYQDGMWTTEGCNIVHEENNIITTQTKLGGALSLRAYVICRPLRSSDHGQVLINMSCALLCLYVVFVMSANATPVPALCGTSAALVHYFMLVYFMWTAAEAVFLYIKLLSIGDKRIRRFTLKAGLVSWLVPFGVVIISAGAGHRYYINGNYCRANGYPFYLGFILPFLAIYLFNWIMFIVIIVSLVRHAKKSFKQSSVTTAAGLALVLGLGWGFGLAASNNKITYLACALQIVFSVFIGCQGLLILLFHGVRNKDAKMTLQSSPFVLDISQFNNQLGNLYYTPGYSYKDDRSSVSGTSLGMFSVGNNGSQQLSQCSPPESAVSHANNSLKNNVSLTWTAPTAGSGPIVFLYAVVVQYSEGVSIFYATLNTTVIPEGCANPLYLNGSTCVTSCPPYYYGNYTSRLCIPVPNGYTNIFNATFYELTFLNTTPVGTILFGFTIYVNPAVVTSGSSVILTITGNIGPGTFASDYFAFLSAHNYVYLHPINSPSDYVVTDQVYYKAQTIIPTFIFNLQSLVPPYQLVGANNVGVTIIGFNGANCSNDLNYCTPTTCLNAGTCYDGYGTYTNCTCAPGFSGTSCSNDINYCTPTTCLIGGTCVEESCPHLMSTGTKTFDWPLFIHRLHVFNVAVEAPILQAANWKISLMIPSITPRFVLIATILLLNIDALLETDPDVMYEAQVPTRIINILKFYSNNAIINETAVFEGKSFAIQLENVNISNSCFTGKGFYVNLGSVDMAREGNQTIAISSNDAGNTTASAQVLPSYPNVCGNAGPSIYRLSFYTFLQDTLFRSPEQEQKGFRLGSIIVSVGGSALSLASQLQFSFQLAREAANASKIEAVQWTSGPYQDGMWTTEGCNIVHEENNIITTQTKLGGGKVDSSSTSTPYQGNFGLLLDLNPGSLSCPAANILTYIGTVASLLSLLLFIITYTCSKPLRSSDHCQVLINMSCALLCLYVVFVMSANATPVPALCGTSAALVHYFMLMYFMWTAAEAVFLYIKLLYPLEL
eukprot:Em0006g42a